MLDKTSLRQLYDKGLSMNDIAQKFDVSLHMVSYWMDKHNLKRRSISDAIYKKLNPYGDPFNFKTYPIQYEQFLLGLGLGIFWGEGTKLSQNGVRVCNTDPFLIFYFRDFLERICGVKRNKIKYHLQLFGDVDKQATIQFWCDFLSIKPDDLGKVTVVKLRGRGTYRRKNKFGVLQIACYNRNLKVIIDNLIRTLKISSYADVAQQVEHVHGETAESLAQMLEN